MAREQYYYAYMDLVQKIAIENNLPFVDHNTYWNSMPLVEWQKCMDDAIHPNELGHQLMYETVIRKIA